MDAAKLRYYAERGHFGHAAVLEPDNFVTQAGPQLGISVAQNSLSGPNEAGINDKTNLGSPEGVPYKGGTVLSPDKFKAQEDQAQAIQDALESRLQKKAAPVTTE